MENREKVDKKVPYPHPNWTQWYEDNYVDEIDYLIDDQEPYDKTDDND